MERWRAALQPMRSAAAHAVLGATWLPINMRERENTPRTEWQSEAFSAKVRLKGLHGPLDSATTFELKICPEGKTLCCIRHASL